MSDTRTAMREFRFLDEKRKQGGLTSAEEQRWNELCGALGIGGAPYQPQEPTYAEPQQGYYAEDGNWYPYPAGYDPGYAAPPEYSPGYDYPAQGYDPNQAAYDPNAYDPNQATYDPNAYDPNQAAYDPNAYDPNQAAYDPNQATYDPNAYDPNQVAYDPNAYDPNQAAYDPIEGVTDSFGAYPASYDPQQHHASSPQPYPGTDYPPQYAPQGYSDASGFAPNPPAPAPEEAWASPGLEEYPPPAQESEEIPEVDAADVFEADEAPAIGEPSEPATIIDADTAPAAFYTPAPQPYPSEVPDSEALYSEVEPQQEGVILESQDAIEEVAEPVQPMEPFASEPEPLAGTSHAPETNEVEQTALADHPVSDPDYLAGTIPEEPIPWQVSSPEQPTGAEQPVWEATPEPEQPAWEATPEPEQPAWEATPESEQPAWEATPESEQPVWEATPEPEEPGPPQAIELDGNAEDPLPLAHHTDFVGYQPLHETGLESHEFALSSDTTSPEITSSTLAGLAQNATDYHVSDEASTYGSATDGSASNEGLEETSPDWAAPSPDTAPEPAWNTAPLGPDAPASFDWAALPDPAPQTAPVPWEDAGGTSSLEPPAAQGDWEDQPIDVEPEAAPAPASHQEELPTIELEPEHEIDLAAEDIVEPDPPPPQPPLTLLSSPTLPSLDAEPPSFEASGGPSSPTFVEGEHRVIIHLAQGQVKRGIVHGLDLTGDSIPLEQQTGFAPEQIPASQVKAIFFMLPVGSRQPVATGDKIRVTFKDGRQVTGFSEDHRIEGRPGFFMIPADNRTNTARIYIYRLSVQAVAAG